jgi:hypothetical protein
LTRLHNEELHNLYASPNVIRLVKSMSMRWAGHVTFMRQSTNVYKILVGKSEVERPLGRPKHRWVDYISMDLREMG